ncbi:MAP3K epsilon protein kinase 1-like isoform X1 [Prunus yedoensis var. nudiflora]|uniref:non-specific serine/threonine protein kinase n=1 Tax=Prunus yedoensis var. nudiflora TaxID=2094558 RepID=A0A314Y7F7_PRUYE|nr:MAP3K epsilon protein kinase 1-like isoform X1 [Prunus yedoensis var. nudiflora]
MPALFRIVQDEHPPIPDSLSHDITDFLGQCFKKDARHRPDAKTLLSHPWIQNCRRALQSSIRHSGTLRKDASIDAEISNGDNQGSGESPAEKVEVAASTIKTDSKKELLSTESSFQNGSDKIPSNKELATSDPTELDDLPHKGNHDAVLANGEVRSPESMTKTVSGKHGGKGVGYRSFGFGQRNQDGSFQKAAKMPVSLGGNELSKFSDTPGDASLDDLFHPLDKHPEDKAS